MDSLSALRVDLARRSKWNIGYLLAGLVYWSFAAIVGTMLPMESAKVLWMIGGFTVFPMAIGFSYVLRSDPFCRGNPLGSLMGLAHGGLITFLLLPARRRRWLDVQLRSADAH